MSWIKDAGKKISGSVKTAAGEVAEFVKDPVEGFNNMGEELRRWRDNVHDLNPGGVSEELWGEAGRFAYPAAAAIMSKRSPTGEPLSNRYKGILRIFAGDLVDRITLHWRTPPLDEWAADNFTIRLSKVDTSAQTFGYDVYIREQKGGLSEFDELKLIGHELVHVGQFSKYGGSYSNFGYHYFKGYKQSGMNYDNIPMEQEAYAWEGEVGQRLGVLLRKPSGGKRPQYLQRVKDHAEWHLTQQTGSADLWNAIHNPAMNDTGETSGLRYLERVRDHAEWYLIEIGKANLWEEIHRSALQDVGEA